MTHRNNQTLQGYRTENLQEFDYYEEQAETRSVLQDLPESPTMSHMPVTGQEQTDSTTQRMLQAILELLQKKNSFSVKVHEPDTYHGDRSLLVVESCTRSTERYLNMSSLHKYNCPDFSKTLMRGNAELWRQHEDRFGANFADSAGSKERFLSTFSLVNANQLARDQLAALVQTGSVQNYVMEFQAICASLTTMTDEEALDKFVRNLKEDVCIYVRTCFPQTCTEAIRIALAYESARLVGWDYQGAQGNYAPQQTTGANSSVPQYLQTNGFTRMDLDAIRFRHSSGRTWKPTNLNANNGRRARLRNKQCFNCGGRGHIARECPSEHVAPHSQQGGHQQRTTY